jgi:hypothetical protein
MRAASPRAKLWLEIAEKGWLESDYYYPTRLGMLKKAAGKFFDSMAARKSLA